MKDEIYRISWFMRGGVSVSELMFSLSREDRLIMNEIIKENIELTKNSGLPLM
jgi:hypothetical protein